MGKYVADTDQIYAFVEKAHQTAERIEQRIVDIEREVETLHVDWTGDAADKHREKHDTWQQSVQEMNTVLSELYNAVHGVHGRYIANVQHNVKMWP